MFGLSEKWEWWWKIPILLKPSYPILCGVNFLHHEEVMGQTISFAHPIPISPFSVYVYVFI